MAEQHGKDGLVVLAVNTWGESKSELKRFVKAKKLKQRILLKGGSIASQYGVTGVPTTLWINRKGVVVDTECGFGGAASLEEKTAKLMKSTG